MYYNSILYSFNYLIRIQMNTQDEYLQCNVRVRVNQHIYYNILYSKIKSTSATSGYANRNT